MIDNNRITQDDLEDLVANVSPRVINYIVKPWIVKHNTMLEPKKVKRRANKIETHNNICNEHDKTKI